MDDPATARRFYCLVARPPIPMCLFSTIVISRNQVHTLFDRCLIFRW